MKLTDPRFGSEGHMRSRWDAAKLSDTFYIPHVVQGAGYEVRDTRGKLVATCPTRAIADALFDALHHYSDCMARGAP